MTATARKMVRCSCANYEFGTYGEDGSAESFESYGTECTQSTWKTFAMGHDAKLAGYLVRAEIAGEEISLTTGGMRVTFPGAVAAAKTVSDAFAAKVADLVMRAVAREAKREAAANRRAAKKAAKGDAPAQTPATPATREATIKIGRWFYTATVDTATGDATYDMKSGETRVAKAGDFQEM